MEKQQIQWNLCNPTPEISDILWHPTKIYGPTVFLLIKIKPEYSDILYNPTHFPGPLVCRIRQVPLYHYNLWFDLIRTEPTIYHIRGEHINDYTTNTVCAFVDHVRLMKVRCQSSNFLFSYVNLNLPPIANPIDTLLYDFLFLYLLPLYTKQQ